MEMSTLTISPEEDNLLDHLKAISSLLSTGSTTLSGNNYSDNDNDNKVLQEATQEFISSADATLRELNVVNSLSALHVEILRQIRNLLLSTSAQWDLLRRLPSSSSASATYQNQSSGSSSPSLPDVILNPLQVAVRSASGALEVQCKKELLLDRSQKLLASLVKKNEGLAKVLAECSGNLEEMLRVEDARKALLSPEHLETLEYTSDVYRRKIEVLQKESEENGEVLEESEIRESLEKLLSLRSKKAALDGEIARTSAEGSLPPNMKEAFEKLNERQRYLEVLTLKIEQQSQAALDLSIND